MLCQVRSNYLLNLFHKKSVCQECKHKKVEIDEKTNKKWVYVDKLYHNEHDFSCEMCCHYQIAEKRVIITWWKECSIENHWIEKLIYTCKPCSEFLQNQNRYTVGKTIYHAIRNLIYDEYNYESDEENNEESDMSDDFIN